MKPLPIGEVARRAGIATSAIRYYEAAGLLPPAERRGGRRVYDRAVLDRLALIALAKRVGFTLAEVRALLHDTREDAAARERWQGLASAKRAELDARIAEAERMRRMLDRVLTCACATLEDCSRTACADGEARAAAGP